MVAHQETTQEARPAPPPPRPNGDGAYSVSPPPNLLTLAQAAHHLNISLRSMRYVAENDKEFPLVRVGLTGKKRKALRVDPTRLKQYLETKTGNHRSRGESKQARPRTLTLVKKW